MRLRLAVSLTLGVVVALGSCRWSEVPQNAVYACDDSACPEGYACVQGYCFLAASVGPDGGDTCRSASAEAACADAGLQCGEAALPDGCGDVRAYSCSACPDGGICRNNACCSVPPAQAWCTDAGFGCGLRELQTCGQSLQVSCGGCSPGMTCLSDDFGSSCQPCVPEGNSEFCERNAATCGLVSGKDNCDIQRNGVDCGGCDGGTCGAAGAGANLCACRAVLSTCKAAQNCCSGMCGDAGLCCEPNGQACADDGNCCSGFCAQGMCVPFADGGHGNGR